MSPHTPGPWSARPVGFMTDAEGLRTSEPTAVEIVPTMAVVRLAPTSRGSHLTRQDMADAARIVACVNACEGVDSDAFPELPGGSLAGFLGVAKAMTKQHVAVKTQRDELAAALRDVLDEIEHCGFGVVTAGTARAALAKVQS